MRKLLLSLIGLLSMAMTQANAEAIVETIDGIRYEIDTETKIAQVKNYYKAREGRYTKEYYYEEATANVPSSVAIGDESYQVELGVEAFLGSPNLTKVTLPATITKIPMKAFSRCTQLQDINIPESVIEIQDGAFNNCSSLTEITLPQELKILGSVDGYFTGAGFKTGVFSYTGIKNINIPGSVEKIGDRCFEYCSALKDVKINEGTRVIGRSTFEADEMIESISLPSTIDSISRNLFYRCKLKSINIPPTIRNIGATAFYANQLSEFEIPEKMEVVRSRLLEGNLISCLKVPANVVRILPAAFSYLRELKELTFSDGSDLLEFEITANNYYGRDPWGEIIQETDFIGSWLRDSSNIEKLYIGRNVATWIPEGYTLPEGMVMNEEVTNPFYFLENIKEITIGELVTDASYLVFENYPKLESLTLLAQEPPVLCPLTAEQAATMMVNVPEEYIETYRNLPGWSDIKNLNKISSVEINPDNANCQIEYFDLRGNKVLNPSKGLYIKRQDNKFEKVIIK